MITLLDNIKSFKVDKLLLHTLAVFTSLALVMAYEATLVPYVGILVGVSVMLWVVPNKVKYSYELSLVTVLILVAIIVAPIIVKSYTFSGWHLLVPFFALFFIKLHGRGKSKES